VIPVIVTTAGIAALAVAMRSLADAAVDLRRTTRSLVAVGDELRVVGDDARSARGRVAALRVLPAQPAPPRPTRPGRPLNDR
jgi:hypothetical protein